MSDDFPVPDDRDPPRGDTTPSLIIRSCDLKAAFVFRIRCVHCKLLHPGLHACVFLAVFQTDHRRGQRPVIPPENIVMPITVLTLFPGDCPVQVVPPLETDHRIDGSRLPGWIEQEILGVGDDGSGFGHVVGLTGAGHQDGQGACGEAKEFRDTHVINKSGYLNLMGLSVNEATSFRM